MTSRLTALAWVVTVATLGASSAMVQAQDWSQWRGEQRDARAMKFAAPKTWPKELTRKWKVTVGDGVASPALVGDKLYVFSRQDGSEVIRCLSAADGKELWSDKYESLGASGPAQGFSGPRSTPAIAGGKLVTLGVRGMVSSYDAATGQKLWRKDDFKAWPNFHPSSSPMIVDGLIIAQLGGRENGALVAYDSKTGEQKWKWSGPSPSYASPILASIGGTQVIIAQTESKLVAVKVADGTLAWELAGGGPGGGGQGGQGGGPGGGGGGEGGRGGRGGGRDYKAATPLLDGQTLIVGGRGFKAVKLEKSGDKIVGTEVWNNADKSVQFASPTLHDGMIYGLAGNNELFCLNAKDGKLAWAAPFPGTGPAADRPAAWRRQVPSVVFGQTPQAEPADPNRPRRPGGPGGQGGPGGGRGRGMGGGGA
jgi:outer membrane protein assembly factor BamB